MATTDVFADLRERFAAAGQSHVFQWYDEGLLSEDQAASLYKELAPLDLPRINKLLEVGDGENEGRRKIKRLAGAFCRMGRECAFLHATLFSGLRHRVVHTIR